MRRTIVDVATGDYYLGCQARLFRELTKIDTTSTMSFWDHIPSNWPSHDDKPYAFKAHALMEAADHSDLLMWLDSCVVPIRSLEPLWRRIETDGYWIAKNGWDNYEWTADSAYPDLFPDVSLDKARELNKTFPQVVATAFGINVRSEIGDMFLKEYYRLSNTKAFCGPWSNTNCPDHREQHPSRMSNCGPPDVLGHRHDQTAASVLAWRLGMKLTICPEIFAYPPGDETTILLANGG